MMVPKNIDQVDWRELSRQVARVRSYTLEQREIYFENILFSLPKESEILGNALFLLVSDFHNCREFNKGAGLEYHDPKNENGQIIRVAMAGLLEKTFLVK